MEWVWIAVIALVCYGIVPGIGAFMARSRWRQFRREVIRSSLFPLASYRSLNEQRQNPSYIGEFRFLGILEGVQEDNTIWIRSENLSLSADMTGQDLFLLPTSEKADQDSPQEVHLPLSHEEVPTRIPWNKVSTLSEGTKVYIAGPLIHLKGTYLFQSFYRQKLLVVFYDGKETNLLKRLIWNSRQRNEYWNQFTPVSLGLGVLAEIILTYYFLNTLHSRVLSILAIAGALVPALPFLPPGFFFFILYRRLWGRARFLRAERDLIRLPLRYFPSKNLTEKIQLPNGELYYCCTASSIQGIPLKQRGKIRTTILKNKQNQIYWFGIEKEGDPYPTASKDPMVENIVILANPETLALHCEKTAYRLELFSSVSFGIGFMVNLFIILRILALIVR